MSTTGRVAVVTGGAQGIGRAIAEGLSATGLRVVVADLAGSEESAAALPGEAVGVHVDVADPEACTRMAAAAEETFGGVDVLVNHAGIYSSLVPTPLEEIDIDEWRRVMDVNVLGLHLASRACLPALRRSEAGRIVNIASGVPFKGVPFLLHYVASKGAVVAMTKAMAKELGGDGILVNAVAPGFTMSDGVKANPVQLEKLQEVSLQARVIRRDQEPEDVVGAVLFLSSDGASFITGQTLVVDGGAYFN